MSLEPKRTRITRNVVITAMGIFVAFGLAKQLTDWESNCKRWPNEATRALLFLNGVKNGSCALPTVRSLELNR